MALENRTISEINEIIINQIEAQIGQTIPILPISFTRVLSKIIAGVFIILYKSAQWIFLQMFVSTASFKSVTIYGKTVTPLIEWGLLVGVGNPFSSTSAQFEISVTVNNPGETLPSGTQFISPLNSLIYITQQDYVLTSGPDTIEVICTTGGTPGNLEVGQILSLANTLGIIDNDATISSIVLAGTDAETEDEYRQRVVDRFQTRPQGGALSDYRIWASDVPGVLQTYIYTGDPPTNVIIYVAGDPSIYADRIPSAGLLDAVGVACTYDPDTGLATRKPIGAILDPAGDGSYSNVLPITVKSFGVTVFDLDVDDAVFVQAQILSALNSFFLSREPYILGLSVLPRKDIINTPSIMAIVNDIVDANNGTFSSAVITFDGSVIPSHILEQGELSDLDSITYST